jgi:coenzyme PQQ biosynthesis protein B
MIRVVVLGAAAGGGFPQWNSNAPGCRRARAGAARASTQASLAVSANERDWFVLNASPDLRLQIEANEALHPREGLRSSPIAGVVVTGGDVDAIAGLLHLRERHRWFRLRWLIQEKRAEGGGRNLVKMRPQNTSANSNSTVKAPRAAFALAA